MAQKIPPAACRLDTHKQFDALWYADRMYSAAFHQTLHTKKFVHDICARIGARTALSHVHATPHTMWVDSFFCNPRHINERKSHVKVASDVQKHAQHMAQHACTPFVSTNHAFRPVQCMGAHAKQWPTFVQHGPMHALLAGYAHAMQKHMPFMSQHMNQLLYAFTKSAHTHAMAQNNVTARPALRVYHAHMESVLTQYVHKRVVWTPHVMDASDMFRSATFVAHYMALQFEHHRKKPFRMVFQDVIKQCVRTQHVMGIKVAVAGRVGGAEKARVETATFGQTSLHVFSHKIDYHATTALTRKGILGIKVWLAFVPPAGATL